MVSPKLDGSKWKNCYDICFGIGIENDDFIFDETKKPNSSKKKILGAIIDKNLRLIHILCMCKKATQILVVLNRISSLLDPEKKKLVFHAVIKSHFSYCPLIRMFSS